LPGRTDNEIKNYWRTRVQKHAKQLKCDVNSKQFKDTMRYLWMPRLVERIQAAAGATTANGTSSVGSDTSSIAANNNLDVNSGQMVLPPSEVINVGHHEFGGAQVTPSYTPENSSTAASSDSFGAQVSPVSDLTDYYNIRPVNNNPSQEYFQAGQVGYPDQTLTSPSVYFNNGLDFQAVEQNNQWLDGGDTSDNLWNVEDIWFLQEQLNYNNNNNNI
jgi:myb proto-oncogene protein